MLQFTTRANFLVFEAVEHPVMILRVEVRHVLDFGDFPPSVVLFHVASKNLLVGHRAQDVRQRSGREAASQPRLHDGREAILKHFAEVALRDLLARAAGVAVGVSGFHQKLLKAEASQAAAVHSFGDLRAVAAILFNVDADRGSQGGFDKLRVVVVRTCTARVEHPGAWATDAEKFQLEIADVGFLAFESRFGKPHDFGVVAPVLLHGFEGQRLDFVAALLFLADFGSRFGEAFLFGGQAASKLGVVASLQRRPLLIVEGGRVQPERNHELFELVHMLFSCGTRRDGDCVALVCPARTEREFRDDCFAENEQRAADFAAVDDGTFAVRNELALRERAFD